MSSIIYPPDILPNFMLHIYASMLTSADCLFATLHRLMTSMSSALDPNRNPVTRSLPIQSSHRLRRVVEEYTHFSRDIVHLLRRARLSLSAWPLVAEELRRNIQEELGNSSGESHFQLLSRGLNEEFGISTRELTPRPYTKDFLHFCHLCMESRCVAYHAGSAYALEATAVSEIRALQTVANELSIRTNMRSLIPRGALASFLDLHISVFEPEHQHQLQLAISAHISDHEHAEFQLGFTDTVSAMDCWWQQMAIDDSFDEILQS